jgi:hypothetical protein
MNGLRLVLVTRRFWPLVGGAETATANLASGLRDLGVTPTILTGRHDALWPADVVRFRCIVCTFRGFAGE